MITLIRFSLSWRIFSSRCAIFKWNSFSRSVDWVTQRRSSSSNRFLASNSDLRNLSSSTWIFSFSSIFWTLSRSNCCCACKSVSFDGPMHILARFSPTRCPRAASSLYLAAFSFHCLDSSFNFTALSIASLRSSLYSSSLPFHSVLICFKTYLNNKKWK